MPSGEPAIPDIDWRPDSFNFVGFHLDDQGPQPFFIDFFSTSPAHAGEEIYRLDNATGTWLAVTDPTVLSAPLVMQSAQTTDILLEDRYGKPCANMTVNATPQMWGNGIPRADDRRGTTDANGRLKMRGIVPGMTYFVMDAKGSRSERDWKDKYYNAQLILIPLPGQERRVSSLDGIDIDFTLDQAQGKRILVCFWDMQQRPSRNGMLQLAQQAEWLQQQGVVVIAIDISGTDKNAVRQWGRDNNVAFPIGTITADREETRETWGIESLPWLILTDETHKIVAEGFGVDELDKTMAASKTEDEPR